MFPKDQIQKWITYPLETQLHTIATAVPSNFSAFIPENCQLTL